MLPGIQNFLLQGTGFPSARSWTGTKARVVSTSKTRVIFAVRFFTMLYLLKYGGWCYRFQDECYALCAASKKKRVSFTENVKESLWR